MSDRRIIVSALFDYTRTHTDELTFKKGDVITVTQQLDGGWWEGSLNGVVGWFPSNYVAALPDTVVSSNPQASSSTLDRQILAHLHSFQDEIVQHILEGEIRQVNELSQLVSSFITHLEPLNHLPFLNKIFHMKELLSQAINMHQAIASALMEIKQHHNEPKRVGKLFLDFASTVNAIGCDYSKVHLYIVTGLDKNVDVIERHLNSQGIKFQPTRCKQQLSLVFDRLGRYPLLLKEIERYLEHPHPDRDDILQAMSVYGEITERCAILRKFKEYDIDILLSTIISWQGVSIDKLGDPILTLRVVLTDIEQDPSDPSPIVLHALSDGSGQLSVIMIFPTCVLLLARTQQSNIYEFTMKLSLNTLTVVGCLETETDMDLLVSACGSDRESVRPCRISLSCTDQNARDLLLSTLTDLIQYQTQIGTQATTVTGSNSNHLLSESATTTSNVGIASLPDGPSRRDSSPASKQSHSASPDTRPLTVSSDGHVPSGVPLRGSTSTTTSSDAITAARETTPPSLQVKPSIATTPISVGPENSPSFSSGMHVLPHQITHHAHVRWLSPPDQKENEKPLPVRVLHSLHLDGPLDMNHQSWSHRVFSYINLGGNPPVPSSGTKSTAFDAEGQVRPRSPKVDGTKEVRRKKSDRQKSAINVDEVLRSVDKLHDNERRTADAALILQVVEAYCASAWTELSCRSVEASQLSGKESSSRLGSTLISPADSKALLQQFSSHPVRQDHQPIMSTEIASATHSNLSKRSGSKSKADLIQAPHSPMDAGLHSVSPPPVILPTRSGRRL